MDVNCRFRSIQSEDGLTRCLSQASLTLAALALLKPETVAMRSAAEWPSRMAQVSLPSLCTMASAFFGPTPGSLAAQTALHVGSRVDPPVLLLDG